MKNYFFIIIILTGLVNSSCSSLQYRKSDKEVEQKFKNINIESEISYYKIDSLNLNVRIQGIGSNEEKVNLVFLHGSPSSLSAWESYLKDATLREKSNMYAIDRPGYGYSNFGKELTSIDTQAQIISAIINEKKLVNVVVIGTSYGGPIAARVAFLNSNVKSILMISPAIDPNNEKNIWASRFTQWKLTRWLIPTGYRVAGDEKKVHAKELKSIEKDWKSIDVPVIHIHGDIDTIVPFENINYSQKNFENIKVVSIPEKGHEIAWEHKELVIPYILELINKILPNQSF